VSVPVTAAEPVAAEAVMVAERPRRDWSAILLVVRKDLTAVRRSKSIMVPMTLVPIVLLIGLPIGLGLFARSAPTDTVSSALSSPLVKELVKPILDLPEREQIVVLVLGYILSPLLLVIPLMVSAALAADAFAGEKERRTLEGLLYLPITDRDLFLAKVLSAFVPALAITWGGAIVYAVVSDVVAWPVLHRVFVPFSQWTVVMAWVAPAVALLGLGLLVIVSGRSKTTQEANQLGVVVILPLIFLAAGQSSALLLAPVPVVIAFGAVIWGVALLLVAINGRRFTRDRLATSS
jgi:ABC-2 type transport system permease protein